MKKQLTQSDSFSRLKLSFYTGLVLASLYNPVYAGKAAAIPKMKLPVDASCDQEFTEAYYAKKDCLFLGEPTQCKNLAYLHKLGIAAAGGGVGALAGKVYDSYLNKDLKFKENFLKAIDEIRKRKSIMKNMFKKMADLQDKAARELSNGAYKNAHELGIKMMYSDNPDPERELYRKVLNAAEASFKSATVLEADPETKLAMEAHLSGDFGRSYSQSRLQLKLGELFPEEMKQLKDYLSEKAFLDRNYADALVNGERDAIIDANGRLLKEFEIKMKAEVAKLSEKVSAVNMLVEHGMSVKYYRKSIFDFAKNIVTKENLIKGANTTGRILKGGAEGIGIGLGIDQTGSYIRHKYFSHYLDKCKTSIGLSNDEISYLDQYNFVTDQNIVYAGTEILNLGSNCDKFKFNMSQESLNETVDKFGGVPKGICKMMKDESAAIDLLFDGDTSKISCDKNDYIKPYKILKLIDAKEFSSEMKKSVYIDEAQWPQTIGLTDKGESSEAWKSLPCSVDLLKSTKKNIECSEMQIKSCYGRMDSTCKWVSEAAKLRVGQNLVSNICPNESKPEIVEKKKDVSGISK